MNSEIDGGGFRVIAAAEQPPSVWSMPAALPETVLTVDWSLYFWRMLLPDSPVFMSWLRITPLLLLLLLPVVGLAQPLVLNADLQGVKLGAGLEYLRDDGGALDLAAVRADGHWLRPSASIIGAPTANFGLTAAAYWFRLPLQVTTVQPPWLLEVSYSLLDYVDVFLLQGDTRLSTQAAGMRRPLAQRLMPHRNFLFPLGALSPGEYTVYLRVQSFHAMQVPLALWQVEDFIWLDEARNVIVGVLAGAMMVMLLYNLLLYSVVRESVYLVYFGVVISVLLLQFGMQGIGLRHFWPQSPDFAERSVVISGLTSTFFSARFTVGFLDLKSRRHVLERPYSWLGQLSLLCALLALVLPPFYTVPMMVLCALIGGVLASGILLTSVSERTRPVIIFFVGWAVLICGVLLLALNKLGLAPMNFFTEQLIAFGIVIQLALFSMALGDRINFDKQQTLAAQAVTLSTLERERQANLMALHNEEQARLAREKTLGLQTQNNHKLEQEIEQRTAELAKATSELREISRIDPLTGIFNRREFNERLNVEFARAARQHGVLTLILFDIDHFKAINDRYGHLVGDACIVHVAQLLRDHMREHFGVVCRYGGEEFAVLLPGKDAALSERLAQTFCVALAGRAVDTQGKTLCLTVSGGVASCQASGEQLGRVLVELADAALYQAKARGRNCIVVAQGARADG